MILIFSICFYQELPSNRDPNQAENTPWFPSVWSLQMPQVPSYPEGQ